ncbi:MAG: HpcH/HpaI aldolase/citrate lyase family protein, partial [Eubacterium sp.]
MQNLLKEKIEKGEKAVGTFFELGSTIAAECLALGGMDYIIIDTEHGPFETESVMEYVCAAQRRNMTPLVRVKDASRAAILKNLDVGAMGLIIPDVRSVDEVKQIIRYGKYYPQGERGVAFARGCGYGFSEPMPIKEYFQDANQNTMLIPQCETRECLDCIEDVVSLDGVDGIFIGPFDLSTALGKPGEFEDPEVKSAIARILK